MVSVFAALIATWVGERNIFYITKSGIGAGNCITHGRKVRFLKIKSQKYAKTHCDYVQENQK